MDGRGIKVIDRSIYSYSNWTMASVVIKREKAGAFSSTDAGTKESLLLQLL